MDWGGVQFELEPPPSEADSLAESGEEAAAEEEPQGPVLPDGPLLFAGERTDPGRVRIRPLAAIQVDSLVPLDARVAGFWDLLIGERLPVGRSFTLMAEDVRVGTLRIDSVDYEAGRCGPVPVASGPVELRPEAMEAQSFVAVAQGDDPGLPYAPFADPTHNYNQRVEGLNLAGEALNQTGARWPPSVLEMRADMQAVPLDGSVGGAIAATFLYQDALRVGDPLTEAAYSLFIVGMADPTGYALGYVGYRPVAQGGKAAERLFQGADWDGDGETELLLEVFGADARWMAALDRRDGRWVKTFEEACPQGGVAP